MWTIFQTSVFLGVAFLLIPVMEKGEGRAVGIIAFCAAFAPTWIVAMGLDWLRYRS
jgi:hypothetical protein